MNLIKLLRSTPLSSLSFSLLSNNDPFTSSHYSDSPALPKQVILVLQLDNLLLAWLIHSPFLSPCLAPRRKETEMRGFASRQVAVLCEAYEKREKKGEVFFFGEAWQREQGAHLRSGGSQSWMICLQKPSPAKRRISCTRVPMEPRQGGEGFQRLSHHCIHACMQLQNIDIISNTHTRICTCPQHTETTRLHQVGPALAGLHNQGD